MKNMVQTLRNKMYLISAEAQGLNGGLDRLNELREKRGLDRVSPGNEADFLDAVLQAVSYTHLDVYKRQGLGLPVTIRSSSVMFPSPLRSQYLTSPARTPLS